MDIFEFIQKFFLILLPGILGSYLYASLNVQKEQHYYFVFLKMIMMSFVSYLLTDALFSGIKQLFPCFIYDSIDIVHQIGAVDAVIPMENVLGAIVFSIILACVLTKAGYENWLFRLANRLKLTRRIDNQTVWEHAFDENSIIVLRDFVTKNTYYGKVVSFSDNSDNREIFFEDVYVFDEMSNPLYHAEQLYLSRAHNEFTIEIHDDTVDNKGERKDESDQEQS